MDLQLTNNGAFKDNGKKREIGDWSALKLLLVNSWFYQYWGDSSIFYTGGN